MAVLPGPDLKKSIVSMARCRRPAFSRMGLVALAGLLGGFSGSFSAAGQAPAEDEAWSVTAPLVSRSLLLGLSRIGNEYVAVGERGHLLVSRDDGVTWEQRRIPTRSMLCAVGAANPETWVAVGHDAVIVQSTDAGATWVRRHFDPDLEKPLFNLWFGDGGHGIAVGAYGLFLETHDGGMSWSERMVDEEEPHFYAAARAVDGAFYMVGEFGGIFRSTDGAVTWERLPSPYEGTFFGVLTLRDGSVLVYGLRGNLFHSADGGDSWQKVETPTEAGLFDAFQDESGTVYLFGQSGAVLVGSQDGLSFLPGRSNSRQAISAALPLPDGTVLTAGEGGVRILPAVEAREAGGQGDGK